MNWANHYTKKKIFVKVNANIKTYYVGSSKTKSVLELKEEEFGFTAVIKNNPQYIVKTWVKSDKSSMSFNYLFPNGLITLLSYINPTNIIKSNKDWIITPYFFDIVDTIRQKIFLYIIIISQ